MSSEVREALNASAVAPLTQKRIDPLLIEYIRRYSPLVYSVPSKSWDTTAYYFNQRTGLPSGGPVTDGGARAVSTSTYNQSNFQIKLFQVVGSVTGFAQAVTRSLAGDLKALEIKGATQSLTWSIETWMVWGSAAATASGVQPGFDGFDALCNTYTGTTPNAIDKADGAFALNYFDELIDLVEENVAAPVSGGDYMIVCSPKCDSRVAQLLTNQQRFVGQVEVAAGLIVPTYRNIPIVKSSFLANRSTQMGTVTPSTATTTGTLPAATYYYRVAAVIDRFGELQASTEVSQVTTGSTSTVSLAFSTPTGPDGAPVDLYKVYRSTSTGTETLLGVVDAFDTTGAATTTIVDTGSNLLTNSSGNTGPAAYVGTNATLGPRSGVSEDMYLVPKTEEFLVRPYVRDITSVPLAATTAAPDTLPFALLTDTTLALKAPKYMGRISRMSVAAL